MRKTGTPNEYRKELKKKILKHTMNEFIHNGIRAVKMDDVAKALKIYKRTVYEIYHDKEEILIDGLSRQYKRAERNDQSNNEQCLNVIELLAHSYQLSIEESATVNPAFFIDLEKYPKALAFIKEKNKERDIHAQEFFKRGVEEGYFRGDVNYDVVTIIGNQHTKAIMEQQLFNIYPMHDLLRNITFVYIRGFCTLKGVELLDKLTQDIKPVEE